MESNLAKTLIDLELTDFVSQIQEEGFITQRDLIELNDEEVKTLAIDMGMKRGHIVRFCRWIREIRENHGRETENIVIKNDSVNPPIADALSLSDVASLSSPSETTNAEEIESKIIKLNDQNLKHDCQHSVNKNTESESFDRIVLMDHSNFASDISSPKNLPKTYGSGIVGTNDDRSKSKNEKLSAVEAARRAALKRRENSSKIISEDDIQSLERRQKSILIGKIESCYAQMNKDPPIGLSASKVDSLNRHLDYVRERVIKYLLNPDDQGKMFSARFNQLEASEPPYNLNNQEKDSEVCSKEK